VVEDQIVAKTVDIMITYVLVIWKLVDNTASLPTKIVIMRKYEVGGRDPEQSLQFARVRLF